LLKAHGEAVHRALLRLTSPKAQPLKVAGFEVTLPGRFWVTTDSKSYTGCGWCMTYVFSA
jgi:hypothetical protein